MLSQVFQPSSIILSQLYLIQQFQMVQFLTKITVSSWRNEVDICETSNGTELLVIQRDNPKCHTLVVILNVSVYPVDAGSIWPWYQSVLHSLWSRLSPPSEFAGDPSYLQLHQVDI